MNSFKSVLILIIFLGFILTNNSVIAINNSETSLITFIEDFETRDSITKSSITIDISENPSADISIDSSSSAIHQNSLHFKSYLNKSYGVISIRFDLNLLISNSRFFGFYYNIKHLGGNYRLTVESTSGASLALDYGATNEYQWEPEGFILDTPNLLLQDNSWHFFETDTVSDIENGLTLLSSPISDFVPKTITSLELFYDQGFVNNELNTDFILFNSTLVSDQVIKQLVSENNLSSYSLSSSDLGINLGGFKEFGNFIALVIFVIVIISILNFFKKFRQLNQSLQKRDQLNTYTKNKTSFFNEKVIYCPQCHRKLSAADKYCPKCKKEF